MEQTKRNLFSVQPGESAFVLHAHPDDEAVLTGSAIMHLATSGVIVHGIVGSDGEASTKSAEFSRNGLRIAELLTSYRMLGDVPKRRIHRLRLPDGELPNYRSVAAKQIAGLIERYSPAALITAGPYGFGHGDHVAMHDAAVEAVDMLGWNDNNVPTIWALQENGTGRVSIQSDYGQKMLAVLSHNSQFPGTVLANGSFEIPAFTMYELAQYQHLLHQAETYERV